jgi:hypothetical protein
VERIDELVKFLLRAQWGERGQHTSICMDKNLKPILVKYASELPPALKGFGLQAWKTIGYIKLMERVAYIIPMSIIKGIP